MISVRDAVLADVNLAPSGVGEALLILELVASRLRELGDARSVFPEVYAVITRRVKMATEGQGPAFLEPQWISHLAGIFCRKYLVALDASLRGESTESEAWDAAFDYCAQDGVAACMNAILGINAHINYDLAQGLHENIVAHGAVDNSKLLARYRHDHDLVNRILAEAIPEILEILVNRYACPITSLVTRSKSVEETVSRAVMFALRQWRARVWDEHLCTMLAAKSPLQKRAVLARMNRKSGMMARALLAGGAALRAGQPLVESAVRSVRLAA